MDDSSEEKTDPQPSTDKTPYPSWWKDYFSLTDEEIRALFDDQDQKNHPLSSTKPLA